MRVLLLCLSLALPIFDLASLIEVGERIGLWPTLAAVAGSILIGGMLVRMQGLALLRQAQETLAADRFPAREVFDGICVLIGGMLLMFPGFVSDGLGILLLLPPVRTLLRRLLGRLALGQAEVWTAAGPGADRPPGPGPVIEGEYEPVEPRAGAAGEPRPRAAAGPDGTPSPWRREPGVPAVVRPEDP